MKLLDNILLQVCANENKESLQKGCLRKLCEVICNKFHPNVNYFYVKQFFSPPCLNCSTYVYMTIIQELMIIKDDHLSIMFNEQ